MNAARATVEAKRKAATLFVPVKTAERTHPLSLFVPTGIGHDFSRMNIQGERTASCPLNAAPCACPFGGACHTCPTVRLQTKLMISEPGDVYEQEADRVAEMIMRMPDPRKDEPETITPSEQVVQRTCTTCENDDEDTLVQKKAASDQKVSSPLDVPPIVQEVLNSPGQPLDHATTGFFEPRFGHGFSQVRVHTDAKAAESGRLRLQRLPNGDENVLHPDARGAADHAINMLRQTNPRIWFDSWYNDHRDNNDNGRFDDDDSEERGTNGRDGAHYNNGNTWPSGARIEWGIWPIHREEHVPVNGIMYKVCVDVVNESYRTQGINLGTRSVAELEGRCRSRGDFRTWREDRGEQYPDLLPGDIVTCKTGKHSHSGILGSNNEIVHLPGPSNWIYFNRFSRNDMESTWPMTWSTFFGITQVSRFVSSERNRRIARYCSSDSKSNSVTTVVDDVLSTHGQPLDRDTRLFMESRFGCNFSDVRVHTDARAAESAQTVNAVAYTVGRDVVFAGGRYQPATRDGQRLLAHELVHVVQQNGDLPYDKVQRSPNSDQTGQCITEDFARTLTDSELYEQIAVLRERLGQRLVSLPDDEALETNLSLLEREVEYRTPRCGPDITSTLSSVLSSVDSYFNSLSEFQKRRSCMALDIDAPIALVNPFMAWDITELFLPNTFFLDRYFTESRCGSPRDPACDSDPERHVCETLGTCGNTVVVGGKCILAGTANYALYGKLFRLCNDRFSPDFPRWDMRTMIWLWKVIPDDPDPPLAVASAVFDGAFPTLPSAAENRGSCIGRCGRIHTRNFHFIWEPYRPR